MLNSTCMYLCDVDQFLYVKAHSHCMYGTIRVIYESHQNILYWFIYVLDCNGVTCVIMFNEWGKLSNFIQHSLM